MVAPKYELLRQDVDGEPSRRHEPQYAIEMSNHSRRNSKQNGTSFGKESDPASDLQTAAAHPRVMQLAIGSLATIFLYLSLSIALTFYQKSLIKQIQYPLSIVTYHLIIKLILAALARALYSWRYGRLRVSIDWRSSLRRMAPTGIASGIDIGFSNWGLELVPISLYTMTKSSTIVFILIFAIFLGLEKKSWSLVSIVGLIATGLFMFTYKSTEFNAQGFIFVLVASLSSGVRWSFAQFIMQKAKMGLHNPIDMIYHMQPWMVMSLLPFLVCFEGAGILDILQKLDQFSNKDILLVILKLNFGALLAFLMEISEFMVLSRTSGLTLSIAGIFKDICQLALAVELNGDQMALVNVLGLVVCMAGICCHLQHKYASMVKANMLNDLQQDVANGNDNAEPHDFAFRTLDSSAGNGGSPAADGYAYGARASTLVMPLLEPTDSEGDSEDDRHKQNASEVLFNVLTRRDMPR